MQIQFVKMPDADRELRQRRIVWRKGHHRSYLTGVIFAVVGGDPNLVRFVIPQECMAPGQVAELRMFLVGRSLAPQAYRL